MGFENDQVYFDDIPRVEDLNFVSLENSYRKVLIFSGLLFWLIVAIGFTILNWFNEDMMAESHQLLIYIAMLILLVTTILFSLFSFRRKAYALRSRDIVYRSGLIWQSETTLPFNRVQHCEVNRGPVERLFNLSSLKVFTAGGQSSDLNIPGLNPERAEKLKFFIIGKTVSDEEE